MQVGHIKSFSETIVDRLKNPNRIGLVVLPHPKARGTESGTQLPKQGALCMSELGGAPKAIFSELLVMEALLEKHFALAAQKLWQEPTVIGFFGESNGSVDLGEAVITDAAQSHLQSAAASSALKKG